MKSDKTFRCEGCNITVEIDKSNPATIPAVWFDKNSQEHLYCGDCDLKLIQDCPLPNDNSILK